MREKERKMARKKLDVEMRPYRRAGKDKHPTNDLLRAVRQTLHIRVAEIAEKMGVCKSVVLDLEAREPKNTVTLRSMSRMAQAMGCKMVYGIVPMGGKTLEALAEKRLWESVLGWGGGNWDCSHPYGSWAREFSWTLGRLPGTNHCDHP